MSIVATGNGQYITTPDITAIDGATAWSISGWFFPTDHANNQFFVTGNGTGGEVMIFFYNTGASIYRTRWDSVTEGGTIIDIPEGDVSLNVWHNYIATFDNTNLRIYLNGVETGDSPGGATGGLSDTETFRFGNHADDNQYTRARLAEFAMWSKTLNVGERAMLQAVPPSRLVPDQLYLPMWNQSSGDFSPLGHTITETGAMSTADHVPLGPPFGFDVPVPYTVAAVADIVILRRRREGY